MNTKPQPNRYIVAVSGGVDSTALLHMLTRMPHLELIVAHYDHGIRSDSYKDREHVQQLAKAYGLPFYYESGDLGEGISEEGARNARYAFLRQLKEAQRARAIITAHHQDDVLETVVHNLRRGTGRLGLAPMSKSVDIVRPLTGLTKRQLVEYARQHNLAWREDPTNQSDAYTRNRIRHHVLPKMSPKNRSKLLLYTSRVKVLNEEIDKLLQEYFAASLAARGLNRRSFAALPDNVSREVMAAWLRNQGIRNFDRKAIERLTHAAKTYQTGKRANVNGNVFLVIRPHHLALDGLER